MRSMSLKVKVLVPAIFAASFATQAMADQYQDTARVLSVTPQVERVNVPRQECRTEYQQQGYRNYNGGNSIAGAVIGGIAGGLLGNTVGRGNGRVAATAVGAGVGAIVGDRIGNNSNRNYRSVPVENCYQVDNWQSVNAGYLVTYEYNGRTYSTVTNNDPGRYIDVNVAVAPNSRVVSNVSYIDPNRYNGNRGYGRGNRANRDHHHDWDDDDRDERRYW